MKLTIGQKILLGYGLAMVCLAVTGVAAYRSTERLLEANDWVRHTFLVIGSTEIIQGDLVEIESATRGYVMTGDESYLEPIEGVRTQLAESRKLLRTLTVDNPAQQRRIDVVDQAIDGRLAGLLRLANMRKEKGFPAALVTMLQIKGKEHTSEIRTLLDVIENDHLYIVNLKIELDYES